MKFVESPPPQKKYVKYDWEQITTELRDHPGKWAELETEGAVSRSAAQAIGQRLREGVVRGTKPGEYEATARGNLVYARYVGVAGEYA